MKVKREATKRVVIYVRISMTRDNQTSTRTQEKECRDYCQLKGWEIVDVVIDEGRSAWKGGKRPGLDKAMAMIETKRANVVLVWKLDRFARSIIHFHELMGRIDRAGGAFVSVTDQIDGSTTQGQIMMALVAGFAQMESDIKSERAAVWQKDRIESGLPNGGQRTYGYKQQVDGHLAINDDEASLLREAAKRILGSESIRQTLRNLAPQSVTGKGPMTARGLRSALTNPTVAGLRRLDDEYVPGNWEAIIGRNEWDALNELLSDPSRRTGSTNQVSHLLSGIMECARCHDKLGIRKWKANPTRRQPYVQESHRLTCNCGNSIDKANAESVVMDQLWQTVTPAVWDQWRTSGKGWDESVIDNLKRARENTLVLQLSGKIDWEFAETQLAEIDKREAMAMGDEPLDLPDVADIRGSWDSLTVTDQRKVIRQAFETITLHPANGTRDPYKRISFA